MESTHRRRSASGTGQSRGSRRRAENPNRLKPACRNDAATPEENGALGKPAARRNAEPAAGPSNRARRARVESVMEIVRLNLNLV